MTTWNYDQTNNLHWRFAGARQSDITRVVFMLHGMGADWTEESDAPIMDRLEGSALLDYFDETRTLVVIPESGVQVIRNSYTKVWDYTDHFLHGVETSRLVSYIYSSKDLFQGVPIFIHGGSAGAMQAWKLASVFEAMDDVNTLSGIVMDNGISPYSVSLTTSPPSRFEGLASTLLYSYEGHNYYSLDTAGHEFVELGLASSSMDWALPTQVLYSPNDTIIPTTYKADFANTLAAHSTNLEIVANVGSGHDTGQDGMAATIDWFKAQV